MTTVPVSRAQARQDVLQFWWIYLITGSAWLLLAVIVFRFDYTTVSAISILFGIVMLGAGVTELLAAFATTGWWRLASALLAVACFVLAIVAFVHPGNTFSALAAVMSFYFIFAGGLNVVFAIAGHRTLDLWWFRLIIGIAELLLGLWAAGYFGRSALLLVVWVGAIALTRGLTEIITAFSVRAALRD